MCAINGFNFRDENLIQRMNKVTRHRGPDDTGIALFDNCSLGHDRLSIIDLSSRGRQPMSTADDRYTITYNGELYNFKEIRDELAGKYKFSSDSDTEVVLYAYAEWGAQMLKRLNGIFAFAIYDRDKNELFLARDRAGVNPLYYYHDGKRFFFSSEMKAILEAGMPRAVDKTAFNHYMRLLYVPAPLTMFANIFKLPAAHYAFFRNNQLSISEYWRVSDFEDLHDYEDAKNMILKTIKESVRWQLISDRPVGVFLSGGIDSTAICGAAREYIPGKVKTYSVGYKANLEEEKYNHDFYLARKTAEAWNTDHHELTISGADVRDNLEKIIYHLDEPVANATAASMFLLAREAKQDVAVVLGGDGGDELFGGYSRYALSRFISHFRDKPVLVRKIVETLLRISRKREVLLKLSTSSGADRILTFVAQKDDLLCSVLNSKVFDTQATHDFFENKFFRGGVPTNDLERYFMEVDRQTWLVDESLLRSNKMTLAHGLEQRVPILDYRMIELTAKIPTAWKIRGTGTCAEGKIIWKEAIAGYLPDHIKREPKRGWFSPTAKWLRDELRETGEEIVFRGLNEELFNKKEVERIWRDHLEYREYNANIIWAIITWHVWHKTFVKT